jgi:N-acetylglutamate synthase-like GNAT family acetyltransferase
MADSKTITIRRTNPADKAFMCAEMQKWWGDEMVVIRAEKYFPAEYGGLIAEYENEKVGLIILRFADALCEVMSLSTDGRHPAAGKKLLAGALMLARENKVEKVIIVTTNDNIQALRFYQQMGFTICDWRKDAAEQARRIKPQIPRAGNYNIPIRDEIELEIIL